MNRRLLVPLVLVGAGLLGALVWWALQTPEETTDLVETGAPTSEEKTREEERRGAHTEPYPFEDFRADFAALHAEPAQGKTWDEEVRENYEKMEDFKVDLRMESAKVKDVIEEIGRQAEKAGIGLRIYTLPPYFPDDFPIGDIVVTQASVAQVLEILQRRTQETIGAYMTPLGFVIGKEGAVQQAQLDAKAARAQIQSRQDALQEILQKPFRPDFQRSTMAQIVRSIKAQTDVDVIVEADVWVVPKVLTWRAPPMTLGQTIDHVCREFGCYYRVKDGRVFLLKP